MICCGLNMLIRFWGCILGMLVHFMIWSQLFAVIRLVMHFNGIFLWCNVGTVLTGIFYTLMYHFYMPFETLSVVMFITFRTLFLDPSVHSMKVSFKSMSVSKDLVTLSAKNVTFWHGARDTRRWRWTRSRGHWWRGSWGWGPTPRWCPRSGRCGTELSASPHKDDLYQGELEGGNNWC